MISAVPAYHEGAPEAVGYVVRNGAYAFYHAGDSRRVQGMAEAVAPHGVDVAFVPITGQNGDHERRRRRAARVRGRGAHRDSLPLRDVPGRHRGPSRFVAECVRIGQEYRLPRAGERITIDYGY